MSFWRQTVPDAEPEDERDSFADLRLEMPTSPGSKAAKQLYDRDLYELVGQLLAHAAKQSQRTKAALSELRLLRVELRRVTRKQTATLVTIATVLQGALEVWRQARGH